MKILSLVLLFLGGCVSPRSMDYQRSKLVIDHQGDLMLSTTPNFLARELLVYQDSIEVINTVLVQNLGTKPSSIDLTKAKASANGASQSVTCISMSNQKSTLTLNSGEKDYIRCSLIVRKSPGPSNDLKIAFSISLPNNKHFESTKVIRDEDFQ